MAPYCAIPRDYLIPPLLRAMGVFVSQHSQLGAMPPPPFLSASPFESMRSGGAIPPAPLKRGISVILARYPMKTRQMGAIPPSAILSREGIARYGGVSLTGSLSLRVNRGVTKSGLVKGWFWRMCLLPSFRLFGIRVHPPCASALFGG